MKILYTVVLILVTLQLNEARIPPIPKDVQDEETTNAVGDCRVKLDFSNMGLSKIGSNFISGPKIISLTLQHNSIEEFQGNTFHSLPNLEYLDLSNNNLSKTKLFSFGSVPSLKTLILDNNLGNDIIEVLRECTSTNSDRYTNIRDGYFTDLVEEPECTETRYERHSALDQMIYLPEVTHLSLRHIFMDSIMDNWAIYFPKVVSLDVSSNRLTSADDFFEKLPATVKNLTMEDVGFTSLRIETLKNVTSLNLNRNHFQIIQRSGCGKEILCTENFDELQTLSIASSSIEQIGSHAFKHAMKLLYLDISNNSLSELSDGTFGYSPLLSYLDISRNPFINTSFIAELKNLTTLKMNGMQDHRSIPSLWSVSLLPKIQFISLRDNKILYIPSMFLENLQNLQEIDLSNNQLSFLSPGLWQQSLKTIRLNGNDVSSIEDLQLSGAKSLQLLELERNNITNIKFSAIKQLPDTVLLKLS